MEDVLRQAGKDREKVIGYIDKYLIKADKQRNYFYEGLLTKLSEHYQNIILNTLKDMAWKTKTHQLKTV